MNLISAAKLTTARRYVIESNSSESMPQRIAAPTRGCAYNT
jgi:hypothetical protein